MEEYAVKLRIIQGIKNEAADMLSSNELIFEPAEKVSTGKFEELVHKVYNIEMSVPVDYEIISQHQAAGKELKDSRTSKDTTKDYKITDFGRTTLCTKKVRTDNTKSGSQNHFAITYSNGTTIPFNTRSKEARGECPI